MDQHTEPPSPYLVALLKVYLGKKRWPFERLASAFWDNDPEFVAYMRRVAAELGLTPPPKPDPLARLLQLRTVEPPAIPAPVTPPSTKGLAPWQFDEGEQ